MTMFRKSIITGTNRLKNKRIAKRIGVLFGCSFVLFALFAGLWISFSDLDFYRDFREEKQDYWYIGKNAEELEEITRDLIRYVQLGGEERLSPYFNEREILHMKDVRNLFALTEWIMGISLLIMIFSVIYAWKMGLHAVFLRFAFRTVSSMLLGFVVMGTGIVLSFDTTFIRFHEIFFSNDLWILDPRTDLMIRMLPQELFTRLFIRAMFYFAMIVAAFMLLTIWMRRKHGNTTNDRPYTA